jgi:hypothetical protein
MCNYQLISKPTSVCIHKRIEVRASENEGTHVPSSVIHHSQEVDGQLLGNLWVKYIQ